MNTNRKSGYAAAVLATVAAVTTAGCGGSGAASPVVPSLSQSAPGAAAHGGSARAGALHTAAVCIRQHGIPGYADPVLTPSGEVYSDSRSIQDASQPVLAAVQQACGHLLTAADLNPGNEPPAPPQLVQSGVRSAECMRAHGMPHVQDPSSRSPYTPGHGFQLTASEVPPGGKQSPIWQHAAHACSAQITAEIQASTLASLSNDG
jgi:hypothetical protein